MTISVLSLAKSTEFFAKKYEWIRVVDESGEDYVCPKEHLVLIDLPKEAGQFIPGVATLATQKRKIRITPNPGCINSATPTAFV